MNIATSEYRINRLIKYAAPSLGVILLAYAAFFSWQSWQQAKHDEINRLTAIASLSERAVDTYFSGLETALRNLGMDISAMQGKLDLERAFTLLHRFLALHGDVSSIMLIRADGQVLLTGKTPHSKQLPTLADDSAFRAFRDALQQGPAFAIGHPVIGHIDNNWVIPARFGIRDQSGKLTHILSASLPTHLLHEFWSESDVPGVSAVGLIRDDGYLLSHYPKPDIATLGQMYENPVAGVMLDYLREHNYPVQGKIEGMGSAGPETTVQVMRRLSHYPVTLFIEMPLSHIQSAWWNRVKIPLSLIAMMVAGLIISTRLALRRRQAWTLEQRREEVRRGYEQALFERSPNEIYLFDAKTLQFTFVNDYALNNLGYSLEEMQRKTLLELHPEFTHESFEALIQPLRKGEQETIKFRTTQTRANGSTYPAEVHLQLVADDDGSGFLAIVNDMTALNQAEENIRQFNAPLERRAKGRSSRVSPPQPGP